MHASVSFYSYVSTDGTNSIIFTISVPLNMEIPSLLCNLHVFGAREIQVYARQKITKE